MGYCKNHIGRHFYRKWGLILSIEDDHHHFAFFEQIRIIQHITTNVYLIEILYIHEYQLVSFWIEVLERTGLYTYIVYLVPCRKSIVNSLSCGYTLELGSHKSRPFAWLHMKKFNNLVNVMIKTDTQSFLNISCTCHTIYIINLFLKTSHHILWTYPCIKLFRGYIA